MAGASGSGSVKAGNQGKISCFLRLFSSIPSQSETQVFMLTLLYGRKSGKIIFDFVNHNVRCYFRVHSQAVKAGEFILASKKIF